MYERSVATGDLQLLQAAHQLLFEAYDDLKQQAIKRLEQAVQEQELRVQAAVQASEKLVQDAHQEYLAAAQLAKESRASETLQLLSDLKQAQADMALQLLSRRRQLLQLKLERLDLVAQLEQQHPPPR